MPSTSYLPVSSMMPSIRDQMPLTIDRVKQLSRVISS